MVGQVEIDYESPIPAYRQVAADIRRRIDGGDLTRRMPSEVHLQQQYGVARDTIRRAIVHLAELGLVYTVAGRGTFVRGGHAVVEAEPGMRVFARPASEQERATMDLADGAWVLVLERRGGEVEVLPASAAEVRVPE